MAAIDDIVNVVIDNQTTAITAEGFGLPLFLGLHKGFTERYREYGSLSEVGVDFATTSNEYIAATSFFGQEVSVRKIAIGRQDSTTVTYTPAVANSATYTVRVNGTDFTYISDASATAAEIVTGLISAINADIPLPVTASGTTTLVLTGDSGVDFSAKATTNLTPAFASNESLTAALDATQLESNDFYGVTCYSHVKADQLEVAAWVNAQEKLGGTSSSDATIINSTFASDSTSVAKALNAAGYTRTYLLYSAEAAKYPECAWMGGEFAREAGAATWKFKQLVGVTVDNLTATQRTNALAKKANIYVPRAGVNMTEEGWCAAGNFIDVVRDSDYFKSRIQAAVFSRLINLPKIPFTDKGIAVIEAELRSETMLAVGAGILADTPAPVISVPKVASISVLDKANRLLPDITITAYLANAVHFADPITVTLKV